MKDIYHITPEEVAERALMPYRLVETEEKMYEEMGRIMADCIEKNHGKQTVIILPVGPIGQYKYLAKEINERGLSLKNCYFINMDEYLDDSDRPIPKDDPLSFHGIMDRVLYSQINPELIMPESQRLFPEPSHEKETDDLIDSFGKVDCCLTGVGINGHIAFNEPAPPEEKLAPHHPANRVRPGHPGRDLRLPRPQAPGKGRPGGLYLPGRLLVLLRQLRARAGEGAQGRLLHHPGLRSGR